MEHIGSRPDRPDEAWQQPFRWVAGIEGSIIPHLNIDQYRWTQHDRFWRQDLELTAWDLKCHWLRYSLPWSTIQSAPTSWDWSWCDDRFDAAAKLGIQLIVDLVHFGVPAWLPDAFGDLLFPDALEAFSREFGRRYRGHPAVASVCPINEPLVTAFFAGDAGLWPPHGTGLQGYTVILSRIAQALSRSIRALRETMGEVEIIHCDSLEVAKTDEPDSSEKTSPHLTESLGADVARRMERRHIVMDLVLGRVGPKHPLRQWLLGHGLPLYDLNWFLRHPQRVDVIGLDYYFHTEVELYTSPEGYYRQRPARKPYGLYRATQAYWHRYHLPFMITETSAAGSDAQKVAWLQRCVEDVRRLRADGFPCIGFTWWPLLDHLDWDGAMLHQTGHIHPVGIYSLRRTEHGELVREPTGLADRYRTLAQGGDAAVGPVATERLTARASAIRKRTPARQVEPPRAMQPPLVIYSRHPWEAFRSRSHHLARQLSTDRRVLFVEPPVSPFAAQPPVRAIREVGGFPLLQVFGDQTLRSGTPSQAHDAMLEHLTSECVHTGFPLHEAIHWVQAAPLGLRLRERFGQAPLVFDVLTGEGGTLQLCRVADAVIFRSRGQQARFEPAVQGLNRFIPDGVEVRHFLKAIQTRTPVPHDSRFIHRPVLAYAGTIDERLDLKLLARLAAETLNWNLVMLGPLARVSPESLPRLGNIYWLGPRPYADLPNYLRGVDACIIPFRQTAEINDYMPGKVYEYLCAGRPVVATQMRELAGRAFKGVRVTASRTDFIKACHEAVSPMMAETRRELIRQVAGRNWRQVGLEAGEVLNYLRAGRATPRTPDPEPLTLV
jgi:beta-glucosidase